MYPISIILPVYNGEKYLKICVDSVLNQTYSNFEFLIIDDCSTDSSWEYLNSLTDRRVKLFRNEKNKGLFFNLNFHATDIYQNWITHAQKCIEFSILVALVLSST